MLPANQGRDYAVRIRALARKGKSNQREEEPMLRNVNGAAHTPANDEDVRPSCSEGEPRDIAARHMIGAQNAGYTIIAVIPTGSYEYVVAAYDPNGETGRRYTTSRAGIDNDGTLLYWGAHHGIATEAEAIRHMIARWEVA